jgi:uncharacterized protein (DUF2141 family)
MQHSRIILVILFLITGLSAGAQCQVNVRVDNFENDKGVCRACLFSTAASFNGEGKPVQCAQAFVKDRASAISFTNVPAGTYAVSVFHDANNNNAFDKNFLGIPKEGYGASRNKLPFASAPGFDANKFTISSGVTNIQVRLRNL